MPFPDAKRVIYAKNPLDRVICQLRFPPILRIEKEVPADFQELIRNEFPEFSEKEELAFPILQGTQKDGSSDAIEKVAPIQTRNYHFHSEDGVWTVNLTRNFLALTTRKYTKREQFNEKLTKPLDAFVELYKPTYFSRVGLRYVDIIKRSELGLQDRDWNELLKPFVLGFLASPDVKNDIQDLDTHFIVSVGDGSSVVRIVTGLVLWKDNEQCFVIDSDFSDKSRIKTDDVRPKLDFFQEHASKLIQWVITPALHDAMEPDEI